MQALGESMFVFGKFLDLEKKVATSEPLIKSLSVEIETFKNKVAILTIEAENDKERVATLEKLISGEGLLQAKGQADQRPRVEATECWGHSGTRF